MASGPGKLVGIDLGTSFSAIATLDDHGQPVTLPNREGEMLTPSAVLIENGTAVVGQPALDVSLEAPDRVATLIKRLVSRVRPGRPNAGKFLGPSWSHANFRESFPSSHSASAVALTVFLARLYPAAAPTFWALALLCAALRYLLDSHWPSDVLGGIALGYGIASAIAWAFLQ